jgi:hypothetical protein
MPLSSSQRALIAVAILVAAAGAGIAFYLHRLHRPAELISSGPPPDLMSQLPADAPALAYANLASLRAIENSPLAAGLGLAGANADQDRDYKEFVERTGFDYSRDLDRAAMAFWPVSGDGTPQSASKGRTLAIAEGRFDAEKIKAYALASRGHVTERNGRTMYEVPGTPPVAFEFLSPSRIAISSGPNAAELLNLAVTKSRDPVMESLVGRVAGAPIFAAARTDNLPGDAYANLRNAPQLERFARSVQGLTMAAKPNGENISVSLDAQCNSVPNAIAIAAQIDVLRMIGSMALSSPDARRQMTADQLAFLNAVLGQTKVSHRDKWVSLNLDITPEMLAASSNAAGRRSRPAGRTAAASHTR